jgi:hypothetical protein
MWKVQAGSCQGQMHTSSSGRIFKDFLRASRYQGIAMELDRDQGVDIAMTAGWRIRGAGSAFCDHARADGSGQYT